MSSDLEGVNGGLSVEPVANGVVVEFIGLSSEIDAILGESVIDLGELAPISGLPCAGEILIGDDTDIDLFDGVFELIHEHVCIGLVDGLLLVSVDTDKGESDSLNVEIVNGRVSEQVIGIEHH